MSTIDPQEFGSLMAKVDRLIVDVDRLTKTVDALVTIRNEGKGALWAGRMILSAMGGVVALLVDRFLR